jgi:RNA polymerase sigma factor (sigma-70 family)
MVDEPDGELLKRFVQGDREAFESLFRQFEVEVFQWVLRIVRDGGIAEDVVVDVFWRAYRGRARFDSSRSFGAWMRRIATNAALDQLRATRRRARWRPIAGDVPAPAASDPALAESVAQAFRALPPRLKVIARLALIEERPLAEIAGALDLPIGTVKSRVFRAVRALRTELTRLGVRP